MATKYTPPGFQVKAFHCPYCEVFANMDWAQLYWFRGGGNIAERPIYEAHCAHCKERSYWHGGRDEHRMLYPPNTTAPQAHGDLPDDCKSDYEEARQIAALSPRGSAALLRLCLQKLCGHLGESGKNINQDISEMVKKGMSVQLQQALDVVRVTGNNAVHPGEMSLEDNPAVVASLFGLINAIVEQLISHPKAVANLYSALPSTSREAIAKRDKP